MKRDISEHIKSDAVDKRINPEKQSRHDINSDRYIGVSINPHTGEDTITNRFTIHYSNTGTHVVPTERRE